MYPPQCNPPRSTPQVEALWQLCLLEAGLEGVGNRACSLFTPQVRVCLLHCVQPTRSPLWERGMAVWERGLLLGLLFAHPLAPPPPPSARVPMK